MESAEKTYVDPSALRCIYVHYKRSRAVCTWRVRVGGSLAVTHHGRAELINSIELAVFRHDIARSAGIAALEDFAEDLGQGRLHVADVPWRQTFEQAGEYSRKYTASLGTRTLDLLHVASAIALRMRYFVTFDQRQAALAKAVGLRLRQPG